YADVVPTLQLLEAYPKAILTNGDPNQQLEKLRVFGISSLFSMIITPSESGAAKPDLAMFEYAARQVHIDNKDCVYIGDQLDADARAASKAGWTGIWLDRAGSAHTVDVPVIHTLAELPELLASLT
ncbi:MAG: HAD family hydrolase, partial [Anaerolineae bacterium]